MVKIVYVVSHTYWDTSEVRAVFEAEEDAQAYIDMIEQDVKERCLHIESVPMFNKGQKS
jgi:uncharacterized protein with PIN domain